MSDQYLFERMVEIIEEGDKNKLLLKECKKVLISLKKGKNCWCSVPLVDTHSVICERAQKLMEKLDE